MHHVTNRANSGGVLFATQADRVLFLEELRDAIERRAWRLLAQCLMPTHFHLILECPEAGLSQGMQVLESRFARRRHGRGGTHGHVFQGRFKSNLIDSDEYLLTALAYVVRNPVKDGLCELPHEWEWSSHRATVHGVADGLTDWPRLLELLGGGGTDGRSRYLALLEVDETAVPPPVVIPLRPRLSTILAKGGTDAVLRAHVEFGYSLRDIGRELGCSATTVLRRVREASA